MKKLKDLVKTHEYWVETIQNELYNELTTYMNKTGKSQNDIAKELGVSKSYVSQILNGNFNFTIKKLIDLSLYMGLLPNFSFSKPEIYLSETTSAKKYEIAKPQNNTYSYLIHDSK